jgi:hypothetical protein
MSNKYKGHTPGPWHWVNSKTDLLFDFGAEWDGEGHPSLRTVAVRKQHEDSIWALPDWIVDAEPMQYGNDAANARLIADAPLLLRQRDELAAALLDIAKADDPTGVWQAQRAKQALARLEESK